MGGKATFLGWLEALRALAGELRPGAWVWVFHRVSSTPQGHSSAPICLFLAVPPLPSLASYQILACWGLSSLISVVSAGTWTLTELSEVLKVPVTSLKRKMTLWLQQGVLREEPEGTFTVIEEEQKDQVEKVVLIDSDEEGDSAMASQADQKEEELQVTCPHDDANILYFGLGNLIKVVDSVCTLDSRFPLQVAESSTDIWVLKWVSLG